MPNKAGRSGDEGTAGDETNPMCLSILNYIILTKNSDMTSVAFGVRDEFGELLYIGISRSACKPIKTAQSYRTSVKHRSGVQTEFLAKE